MVLAKDIIKLAFRLFVIPIQLMFYFLSFLVISVAALSGGVIAPLYVLFLAGAILCLIDHLWMTAAVGFGLMFLIFLCYCGAGTIVAILQLMADGLGSFFD